MQRTPFAQQRPNTDPAKPEYFRPLLPRTFAGIWLLPILFTALACSPIMIDRDGHKVFNPAYVSMLESDRRDRWQMPDEVCDALKISESDVIADIGAGGGYFSRRFSDRIGPNGRVYATDVQQAMIDELETRITDAGYDNVEVVLAGFDDPRLPLSCCDLVFFGNVYKEIHSRIAYMTKVRATLKPHGRVAILGFRPGDGFAGPPQAIRLAQHQVIQEVEAAGFRLTDSYDFLPRQYLLIFEPNVQS